MEFSRLTRKHGVKIPLSASYTAEDCSLAVGELVGHRSVKSAARMNNAVVIFLDSVEKAEAVAVSGITVHGALVSVLPLTTPAVRVTVANVPPFIEDQALVTELAKYGKVVSPVRKVPSGCRSPLLRHVVSHKRTVFMVLHNRAQELNLVFRVTVEDFVYVIYASTDNTRCFRCGREGHLARTCPGKKSTGGAEEQGLQDPVEAMGGHQDGQAGTGGTQQEGQEETSEIKRVVEVTEGGKQGTDEVQQGGEASERAQEGKREQAGEMGGEGTGEVQQEREVCEGGEDGGCGGAQLAGQESDTATEGTIEAQQGSQERVGASENASGVQQVVQGGEKQQMLSENSEEDMEEEEEGRKAPLKRRKTRSSGGASRAKKGSKNRRGVGVSESGSSAEWDSTEEASSGGTVTSRYGVGRVKLFLKVTKNMKGVDLEEYFTDREKLSRTVRQSVSKKGSGRYTQQEVFRLRKLVLRLNRESEDASANREGDAGV